LVGRALFWNKTVVFDTLRADKGGKKVIWLWFRNGGDSLPRMFIAALTHFLFLARNATKIRTPREQIYIFLAVNINQSAAAAD